jgi:CRP/FNR family transcriptional regulator, cyclic AMP receptor protein
MAGAMTPTTAPRPSALGLRGIKLLAGLDSHGLEALAQQCRWRRVPAGQRVTSREARENDLYLIVSGKVRITAFSAAGRQVTFRDIGAGDWFGDLSALDGQARSADVEALQDTLVASMTPAVFKSLVHSHPEICDQVLDRLVTLVRDLTERVFDFSTLGVQNRVHAELLRLAKHAGVERNVATIDPAPTHSDIAGKVSTYREQVTRELSAMVKQGLLQRRGRALLVIDVARLERMVAEVRRSA